MSICPLHTCLLTSITTSFSASYHILDSVACAPTYSSLSQFFPTDSTPFPQLHRFPNRHSQLLHPYRIAPYLRSHPPAFSLFLSFLYRSVIVSLLATSCPPSSACHLLSFQICSPLNLPPSLFTRALSYSVCFLSNIQLTYTLCLGSFLQAEIRRCSFPALDVDGAEIVPCKALSN